MSTSTCSAHRSIPICPTTSIDDMSEMLLLGRAGGGSSWPRPAADVAERTAACARRRAGVATTRNVLFDPLDDRRRWRATAVDIAGVGSIRPSFDEHRKQRLGDDAERVVMVARHGRFCTRPATSSGSPSTFDLATPEASSSTAAVDHAVGKRLLRRATQPIAATPRTRRRRTAAHRRARTGGRAWARSRRRAAARRTGAPSPRRSKRNPMPSSRRRIITAELYGSNTRMLSTSYTTGPSGSNRDRSSNVRSNVSAAARSAVGPRSWA